MKYFIAILLCLSINNSFAQNGIKIGANAGATYSSLRGNPGAAADKSAFNILFGGTIDYSLDENLSLRLEINLDNKSVKAEDLIEIREDEFAEPRFETIDAKVNLQYVSFPLTLKYRFSKNRDFFINAGPFLSVFIKENTKVTGGFNEFDLDNPNSDELYQKIDFGLTFGIGKSFSINDTSTLNLELRNNLGFNNISRVEVRDDGVIRTNSLNLILNWEFNL